MSTTKNERAIARNFFFSRVFSAKEDRQRVFDSVKSFTTDEKKMNDFVKQMRGMMPPFDTSRYQAVRAEAKRIATNPEEMKKILTRTRFCTIKKCTGKYCKGAFAHNLEEYNTPTCLQGVFCQDENCTKNHGFTKEEYVSYYNIAVPEKASLERIKFCSHMTNEQPCYSGKCTFAHSLWELRTMECNNIGCSEQCKLFHEGDDMFSYMEKQGIVVEPWMLRSTELNNHIEFKRRVVDEDEKFQREYVAEIKRLEANNWDDMRSQAEKDAERETYVTRCKSPEFYGYENVPDTDSESSGDEMEMNSEMDMDTDSDSDSDSDDGIRVTFSGKSYFDMCEFLEQKKNAKNASVTTSPALSAVSVNEKLASIFDELTV